MKKHVSLFVFAVLMAGAAPAAMGATPGCDGCFEVAQGGWFGWPGRRGEGREDGPGFLQRFEAIDANDDGRISDDEAAAQRESVFLAMDADDDGELTEEEYMTVRMGPGEGRNEERRKQREEQKRSRFKPMDVDTSGKVSKGEWMTAGKARFAAADGDKDGVVTPWEFRSQQRE